MSILCEAEQLQLVQTAPWQSARETYTHLQLDEKHSERSHSSSVFWGDGTEVQNHSSADAVPQHGQ